MKPHEIKRAEKHELKKEKNISSTQGTVKVTLSDATTDLSRQETALLLNYGLLMYNFCS